MVFENWWLGRGKKQISFLQRNGILAVSKTHYSNNKEIKILFIFFLFNKIPSLSSEDMFLYTGGGNHNEHEAIIN